MKGYISKSSENYISVKDEYDFQNSLKQKATTLATYITYKLILLVERSAHLQIWKLTNEFSLTTDFFNQINVVWINSYNLQYKKIKAFSSDNYYNRGEIGNILVKSFRQKKFTELERKDMLHNSKNCQELFQIMEENYEMIKKRIFEKKENSPDINKSRSKSKRKTKVTYVRKTKTFIFDENAVRSPILNKKTESGSAMLMHGQRNPNFLKKKITEILINLKEQKITEKSE